MGLDANPDMINMARVAAEQERLTIEWYTSPAEQLPFPDEHFDLVLCQFGLMFFADRHAALNEMHRVLRKGGTLIIAHALSSEEIKAHHKGASPVSRDFLPEEKEMRELMANVGFRVARLIDRPKCYLCEGNKGF